MNHSHELNNESEDRCYDDYKTTVGGPFSVEFYLTHAFIHSLIQVNHFTNDNPDTWRENSNEKVKEN